MISWRSVRAGLLVGLLTSILSAQQDRIYGQIDRHNSVVVHGSIPIQARPQFDQGEVETDFQLGNITLVLKPSSAQ